MKLFLFLVFLNLGQALFSQALNAYHDYRNYFMVFDQGKTSPVEHLPAMKFAVGDKCIAYIDHNNHLKAYHNGKVHDLSKLIHEYKLTDNLLAFKVADQLFVFDQGEKHLLTINATKYLVGDNLVLFFDETDRMLKAYYSGKILDLEDALSDNPLYNFKVGDSMAAYLDNQNNLKAFRSGETKEIAYYAGKIKYEVGGNLLVYVDYSDNTLYVYDRGEVIPLESFPPKSFQLGDDFVAYVDHTGTFKFYKDNYKETILSYPPDFYLVKDNLVIYSDRGYFNVYYQNRSYTLEDYVPSDYQYDLNSVAYKDVNGRLKLFKEGTVRTVSYDKVNQYKLAGNTLYYEEGLATDKVLYEE